jgi:hypothetical protein
MNELPEWFQDSIRKGKLSDKPIPSVDTILQDFSDPLSTEELKTLVQMFTIYQIAQNPSSYGTIPEHEYFDALFAVANLYAARGMMVQSNVILRKIAADIPRVPEVNVYRYDHEMQLIEGFVQVGELEKALQIVLDSSAERIELERRAKYAQALSRFEYNVESGIQLDIIQQSIGDLDDEEIDLYIIADAFVAGSRFDLASKCYHQLVPRISVIYNDFVDNDLADLSAKLATAHDLQAALHVAASIENGYNRSNAYLSIVAALADINRLDEVEQVITHIEDDDEQSHYGEAEAKIVFAQALYRTGKQNNALALLEKVFASIDLIPSPTHKLHLTCQLGPAFALMGREDQMWAAYSEINRVTTSYEEILGKTRQDNVRFAAEINYRFINSLIAAGQLEYAHDKLKKMHGNELYSENYYSRAERALSSAFSEHRQYVKAFQLFEVSRFTALASPITFLAQHAPQASNVGIDVIESAIPIVGWIRFDWEDVDNGLLSN